MTNISQIKVDSDWGQEAARINQNFQNMNTDLEKVKSATTKFRGYFTSEAGLKQKYPSPQVGDTAWVGEPYPGKVYDVVTDGTWHNTDTAPDTESVELQDYAKKAELTELELRNDSIIINVVGFGNNAEQGGVTKTGDIYYRTDLKDFRKCVDFENSQYETIQVLPNTIMHYQGVYYCDLVDKVISEETLWSLTKLLTTDPKKSGLSEFSILGKIREGKGIMSDNGGAFESTNFSYVEFDVYGDTDYIASVPYQSNLFGIAFFDSEDTFIDGLRYKVDSNYMSLPLYTLRFTTPQNAKKAKATIFNETNRNVNGHYSYFYPLIENSKTIDITGIAEDASSANVKSLGDIYFQSTTKKFRKKILDNIFADVDVTDETVIKYKELTFYGISNFKKGIVSNNLQKVDLSSYANLVEGGGINYQDGTIFTASQSYAKCINYIPCANVKIIDISIPCGSVVTSVAGIAFYDENFQYIDGTQRPYLNTTQRVKIKIIPPANAVYFRTTYFNSSETVSKGGFNCIAYYNDIILKTEHLDYRDIVDGVGINISPMGSVYTTSTLGATSYINCKGALYMDVRLPVLTTIPSQGLVFYDEENNPINGLLRPQGNSEGIEDKRIYIPGNAVKFKTTYWNFENSQTYGDFSCDIYFIDDGVKYREYQKDLIFFSEKINQSVNNFWDNTNEIVNPIKFKSTTGVLLLPDNYSPNANPVPIIMYCHGFSHGVWYDTWGSTDTFLLQKKKWASMGFAVFDCNGARNNNRKVNFTGAGSIQFVTAYRKCFEYIKQHYNVEDRICVVAGSAGGITGINFCYMYSDLVKKCVLLSAWTDLKKCSWEQGVRDTFVEYLGFSNTTDYEEEKTIGYDPAKRIINISGAEMCNYPVAVKAWIGSSEVGSALYEPFFRFINALRNAGNTAYIREVEGLTHEEVVSGNNDVVDTEVALWFNL